MRVRPQNLLPTVYNHHTWFMGHCLAWQRVFFEVFSGFLGHLFYIMKGIIFDGGYDRVMDFVEGWHILIITKFF